MNKPVAEQPYLQDYDEKISSNKAVHVYSLFLFFGACILFGCIPLFYNLPWVEWIQLAGLLFLGCLYIRQLLKSRGSENRVLFVDALYFSLAYFLALITIYYFKGSVDFYYVLSLACAFLLPSIILESWYAFQVIPSKQKQVWHYSKEIPAEPLFVYLENKPVRIKIIDERMPETEIKTVTPTSLQLGTAFYYIVKAADPVSQNSHYFMDENENPHGWLFYTKRNPFGKSFLKPDETIAENRIKPNAVIFAERVS